MLQIAKKEQKLQKINIFTDLKHDFNASLDQLDSFFELLKKT